MRGRLRRVIVSLIIATIVSPGTQRIAAQDIPGERTFPRPKAEIDKVLKTLRPFIAGRLPTVEGFIVASDLPLTRFQRAYYQSTVQVTPITSGASRVRVEAKISAWYADPNPARAGYKVLPSNGRIESDLLDRLAEAINGDPQRRDDGPAPPTKPGPEPVLSAPLPRIPDDAVRRSSAAAGATESLKSQTDAAEKREQELAAEAKGLEEILQNQSHPTNLVAVKKTGTPVLQSPAVDAKVLFSATAGDEFEILDVNSSWVHVRISGLSRGWIRRSSLEMPDELANSQSQGGSPRRDQGDEFRVSKEQLAPFPGDWDPLRGKIVKIVTVQKTDENGKTSTTARLQYAQALLLKQYAELSSSPDAPAGIVLIFDSDDGGMIAAPMATLKDWSGKATSDSAAWSQCFFDPPELFGTNQ